MPLFDTADQIVSEAEELAIILTNEEIKSHQMRRIYEQVQYIHDKSINAGFSGVERDLKLLKPQIAYAVHRKPNLSPLHDRVNSLIDGISDNEGIKEFYDFLMALMCYHKFYSK